uniref:Leucine rich repeat protein n=1 Tax=Macrostomum lignano TaxID=282301 RepID=A0A1I8FQT7_9PLAT
MARFNEIIGCWAGRVTTAAAAGLSRTASPADRWQRTANRLEEADRPHGVDGKQDGDAHKAAADRAESGDRQASHRPQDSTEIFVQPVLVSAQKLSASAVKARAQASCHSLTPRGSRRCSRSPCAEDLAELWTVPPTPSSFRVFNRLYRSPLLCFLPMAEGLAFPLLLLPPVCTSYNFRFLPVKCYGGSAVRSINSPAGSHPSQSSVQKPAADASNKKAISEMKFAEINETAHRSVTRPTSSQLGVERAAVRHLGAETPGIKRSAHRSARALGATRGAVRSATNLGRQQPPARLPPMMRDPSMCCGNGHEPESSDAQDVLRQRYESSCASSAWCPSPLSSGSFGRDRLHMRGRPLGPKGTKAVAMSLRNSESISSISIPENNILDDGLLALCDMVNTARRLRELDLSSNGLAERGLAGLCSALLNNNSLAKLDLSHNSITDKEAAFVCKLLEATMTHWKCWISAGTASEKREQQPDERNS